MPVAAAVLDTIRQFTLVVEGWVEEPLLERIRRITEIVHQQLVLFPEPVVVQVAGRTQKHKDVVDPESSLFE